MFGRHQAENVTLAIAAVEAFLGGERPLPEEVLEEGLRQLTVPGRLQLIGTEPVVYVDAAHNPHGAEVLARAVTESFGFDELAVVVGVLADKDAGGVLEALAPIADALILTPVDSPRSLDLEQLVGVARAAGFETTGAGNDGSGERDLEVAVSLPVALEAARDWASQSPGRGVLVAGSVLLAGETIAHARAEGWGIA